MNIYFQTKNTESHDDLKQSIAERITGLDKFFPPFTNIYIDMEKTHSSHKGNDLYYVSLNIDDRGQHYFVEEYRENLKKAFDFAYESIERIVKNDRNKSRNLTRRAASRIKKLFRKNP